MNSLNRDQWTAVDERFDKEFHCGTIGCNCADGVGSIVAVKDFLHQELSRVREETIKACYEVAKDWENTKEYTPDDDFWGRGFDEAKIGISKAITKLITKP